MECNVVNTGVIDRIKNIHLYKSVKLKSLFFKNVLGGSYILGKNLPSSLAKVNIKP